MSQIKWFSGGTDRAEQAIKLIDTVMNELENELNCAELKRVLIEYRSELDKKETSVPFILSRMNLDLSKAVRNDGVVLPSEISDKLKELSSLSNIRYGY